MKRQILSLLLLFVSIAASSQTVTISFTAQDTNAYPVRLNRVTITNLSKNWQETIFWPDTALTMQLGTGIDDYGKVSRVVVLQNKPNPCDGTTEVCLAVPEDGPVQLEMTDLRGRLVSSQEMSLQRGVHCFRVTLSSAGTYVMTARQNGQSGSVKMVCNRGAGSDNIDYLGAGPDIDYMLKSVNTNPYNHGDTMEYVGYADICGAEAESRHVVTQLFHITCTLHFSEAQCFLPEVLTNAIVEFTDTTATGGGRVISGGGAPVTARGLCWSTSPNPTVSDNHTTEGDSLGSFTSYLTGLTPGTRYYVRAYAVNIMGTAYGDTVSFTTWPAFHCGIDLVVDIDGNTYTTLQLGTQCWMKENLRTTHYSDGTPIQQGSSTSVDVAYWYYPHNDATTVPLYGLLYNRTAAVGVTASGMPNRNICPVRWHLPDINEWFDLTNYVGSQSQYWCNNNSNYIAKALASTEGWGTSPNTCSVGNNPSANNATGFSAMPAGSYYGSYGDFWGAAHFWTPNMQQNQGQVFSLTMGGASPNPFNTRQLYYGNSVRCVHD
ncbi:MAG: hypothetical protein IKQ75_02950 [Bacteroidales bacterium]|nr:hypothetical protein [Bacteroidales bacterium]MBR6160806.1 hypothetical protein [Bacteroidales bacterium]